MPQATGPWWDEWQGCGALCERERVELVGRRGLHRHVRQLERRQHPEEHHHHELRALTRMRSDLRDSIAVHEKNQKKQLASGCWLLASLLDCVAHIMSQCAHPAWGEALRQTDAQAWQRTVSMLCAFLSVW